MGKVVYENTARADTELRDGNQGLYRHEGLAWLESAKVLEKARKGFGLGPFYYIVAHACELFTKAFLLWRGVSHEELRSKKLSHDIPKLLDKAQEYGLQLEEEFTPFFEALDNMNRDHKQRYPKLGFYTMGRLDYVEPSKMIYWAEKYYEKIYGIIQRERNDKNQ